MPQSLQGHMPELLPEYEKISSIVDGPGRDPLGSVSKLVEAVVDISNQLPTHGKLGLDVSWEEVLETGGKKRDSGLLLTLRKRTSWSLPATSRTPLPGDPTRTGGG